MFQTKFQRISLSFFVNFETTSKEEIEVVKIDRWISTFKTCLFDLKYHCYLIVLLKRKQLPLVSP